MRSILSLADLSPSELDLVLKRAAHIKQEFQKGEQMESLKGKVVGVLFEKPSTRTRASFEVATLRLGGHSLYLASTELQLSRGEPVKDTARILGGYLDVLVGRVYHHETLEELGTFSKVPVINALSDLEHPTQAISDLLTIRETKGGFKGLTLAFVGDGDNVCNSLLLGASMVGMNVTVACPRGYSPNAEILRLARRNGRASGSVVKVLQDPRAAATGADILYTDVWISMGEESEKSARMKAFRGFQINSELLKLAARDATVMHCLPAHRGMEITDQVIEGRQSVVWQQGENKLYGAAAALDFVVRN